MSVYLPHSRDFIAEHAGFQPDPSLDGASFAAGMIASLDNRNTIRGITSCVEHRRGR